MKTTIKHDGASITLSDDCLDNDNYVNVAIEFEGGETSMDVPLWELMPALIAFDAKRSRRLSEENLNP